MVKIFIPKQNEIQNADKKLELEIKRIETEHKAIDTELEAVKKVMWMHELGEGIPQDKTKAAEWRKKLNDSDEE